MSSIADIEEILELKPLGNKRFVSKTLSVPPPGARGTFGGELIAQALLAALHTVPYNFVPCSLHAYFVTAGSSDIYLEYQVEDIRKGRSFIHQEVKCYQGSRLVYWTAILWTLEKPVSEDALHHYKKLSPRQLAPLESMKSGADLYQSQLAGTENFSKNYLKSFQVGPVDYRFPSDMFMPDGPKNRVGYYVRVRAPITRDCHSKHGGSVNPRNDLRYNYVALAYLSDLYFLYTSRTFQGQPLFEKYSRTVSLDHSIHFHGLPVVNDWLFFEIRHPRSANQRNLVQGEYYNPSTREILASTTQEGATLYLYKDVKSKL
ncbi:hypothetical protein ZYGR_0U02150 [Zygosaccharomyces rouxii]|uniref:Acyl-CoA thioesterase II n=1 Tax=Zygosaccharomyces rouxii TaxID=4956 RepID=A0A1Q3A3V5_ZYGRO|nr:hypothetical protein ZYGR_0U02150 [Zygosaccharomyces rouxii]